MSTVTPTPESYSLETGWKTLAVAGGSIAVLGVLAMILPLAVGVAVSYIVGGLLIVGGLVHGAHVVSAKGWMGSLWQLTLAIVSLVAGIVIVVNPIIGLLSLTLMIVAYLLVDGIVELGVSLRMERGSGRGWIAASGGLSLGLGVLLWAQFPEVAAWVVGFMIGASLFLTGLSMVAVAYTGRQPVEDITPPAGEPRGM
ncbi:HdeD family acid-resistance protein [Natranaeroarchaeum aerophilus]|uniref:DUF308 domain-containing protein n=1 Tax=Natranaeroarchaeum aerophilus TaxID=2917711 RepID=A0AAE3K4S5_9EURY|nr:DUF308 domain-containing protein [Natranaeroarchaeum aerophilus]MCL9813702.1 DUF308 domain-containing protein [Natranaeroarchaeum aerophilus]